MIEGFIAGKNCKTSGFCFIPAALSATTFNFITPKPSIARLLEFMKLPQMNSRSGDNFPIAVYGVVYKTAQEHRQR